MSSLPVSSAVRGTWSLVLCVFGVDRFIVLLYFFFWPLYCLFFFDSDNYFGIFKLLTDDVLFYLDWPTRFVNVMVLLYPRTDYSDSKPICSYFYSLIWCVHSCEAANTNFIVFALPLFLSEIMVGCKRVSGIWTVLRSLPAKYKTQHLSIIYSILGLDFDRTL